LGGGGKATKHIKRVAVAILRTQMGRGGGGGVHRRLGGKETSSWFVEACTGRKNTKKGRML